MSDKTLPKIGDKIPIDKFFVSKMNARAGEIFGKEPEDEALVKHLTYRNLVQMIIARPEGKGYGVVVGRRRFLSKKKAGTKHLVVGTDCVIKNMPDKEALDASLLENLDLFRKSMNPVSRAKALSKLIDLRMTGIRGLARRWRVPHSSLVEWLKIAELNPKMQEVTEKRLIYYTDALTTARLKLGDEKQNELAEIVETSGLDSFRKELAALQTGKGKRGIPAGKYFIIRCPYDKRYKKDVENFEKLVKLAESQQMDINDYVKKVVIPTFLKGH